MLLPTYRHGEDDGGIVLSRDAVQCLQVAQLKIVVIVIVRENKVTCKAWGLCWTTFAASFKAVEAWELFPGKVTE